MSLAQNRLEPGIGMRIDHAFTGFRTEKVRFFAVNHHDRAIQQPVVKRPEIWSGGCIVKAGKLTGEGGIIIHDEPVGRFGCKLACKFQPVFVLKRRKLVADRVFKICGNLLKRTGTHPVTQCCRDAVDRTHLDMRPDIVEDNAGHLFRRVPAGHNKGVEPTAGSPEDGKSFQTQFLYCQSDIVFFDRKGIVSPVGIPVAFSASAIIEGDNVMIQSVKVSSDIIEISGISGKSRQADHWNAGVAICRAGDPVPAMELETVRALPGEILRQRGSFSHAVRVRSFRRSAHDRLQKRFRLGFFQKIGGRTALCQ